MAAQSVADSKLDAELLEVKDKIKQQKRYIADAEQELESKNVPVETRLQLLHIDVALLNTLCIKERDLKSMLRLL